MWGRLLVPSCKNILPLKTNKVVDDFIKASPASTSKKREVSGRQDWCLSRRGNGSPVYMKGKKFLKHFIVHIVGFD